MTDPLEYVLKQVRLRAWERPDAIAIIDEHASVTRRRLVRTASRICKRLKGSGVSQGDRACLLASHGPDSVAALLGMFELGIVYIPLDPHTPATRLASTIQQCAPCAIVVEPSQLELLDLVSKQLDPGSITAVVVLEPEAHPPFTNVAAPNPDALLPLDRSADDITHIMFTSGSTGEPKGVPITAGGIAHFVMWAISAFPLDENDRMCGHAPLHFDASLWEVFLTLCTGAELHLVPRRAQLVPDLAAEFIRSHGLTVWSSVPSTLVAMLGRGAIGYEDFPSLRHVIWYGDALHPAHVRTLMERVPHATFSNLYGPTEITNVCCGHTLTMPPLGEHPVPIGDPIPEKSMVVVDADDQEVEPGVVGDLLIGGEGLSPGYWRSPEATLAVFCEWPAKSGERHYRSGDLASRDASGAFRFHGRADRQIKIRGRRVELDDIASSLSAIAALAEVAVVALPGDDLEAPSVCAAFVARPGYVVTESDLVSELSRSLPKYMHPARWRAEVALPRNRTGKVDHAAILGRFAADTAAPTVHSTPAPGATIEVQLDACLPTIFASEMPAHDVDLIDLGVVDSAGFMQMLSLLEDEFDIEIAASDLDIHNFRTVTSIANFLRAKRDD